VSNFKNKLRNSNNIHAGSAAAGKIIDWDNLVFA
jgi:hypothetical protein